ncbi:MAG TPA: SUMF1/EgtB/PvdO family nonheme iron enzyme [Prolixibacteraceae bacterium]|jgi:gliding motility-associated lipoprotein GldK
MKKHFPIGLLVWTFVHLTGCGKIGNGYIKGVKGRESWVETNPYGMTFVHSGTFDIGFKDQDVTASSTPTKTVSIDAFWMDDTEITNNEYRQFVEWVRDSIARGLLSDQFPEFLTTEDHQGNPVDPPRINWKKRIEWNNPDYAETLSPLYIPEDEQLFRKKEIDARKLFYDYSWIDLKQAARRVNRYDYASQSYKGSVANAKGEERVIQNRSSFIMNDQTAVFPDTLCQIRDFTFSYNEPWATNYFWHPAYDDYPVVGVAWKQAKAFCHWRTKFHSDYLATRREPALLDYRLPTEIEWEYAARGDRQLSMYPWGGYYTRQQEGDFNANFKPLRGDYIEDGGLATIKVASYDSNDFGLYDMAGNVAEWTGSAYDESAYMYINDFNPNFEYNAKADEPPAMKRKVIRGGSWKDVSEFLQVSARSFEYQDTAKSYIGFRCVRSRLSNEY